MAITGSAGKTTTKEVTGEFLGSRYRVVRNRGNFNNHIGLPLSLMELRQRPEIAVVELGMNHAGEISTLVRSQNPTTGVTNVGGLISAFSVVAAIADAKAEIFEGATQATLLFANATTMRGSPRNVRLGGASSLWQGREADLRADVVVTAGPMQAARLTTPRGASRHDPDRRRANWEHLAATGGAVASNSKAARAMAESAESAAAGDAARRGASIVGRLR